LATDNFFGYRITVTAENVNTLTSLQRTNSFEVYIGSFKLVIENLMAGGGKRMFV
jgi:hypothetical protein